MGRSVRVFLRSTLRQPVRSILLLLLAAAAAFAFTVRFLECTLVLRETGRAESYYRAIGDLEQTGESADLRGATEYLERSPYVKLVEKQRTAAGILPEGIYNGDLDGNAPNFYIGGHQSDIVFYGAVQNVRRDGEALLVGVTVDREVTGYPEYLWPGKRLELKVPAAYEAAAEDLTPGTRYLLRARYDKFDRDYCYDYGAMQKYLFAPLTEGGAPFLEAPSDLDLAAPEYAALALEVRMIHESQQTMNVLAVSDMSALPSVQETGRVYYLREGRLLTAEDTAEDRPVCVIRDTFASLRGYRLGDTITLTLRNLTPLAGYLIPDADTYASYDDTPTQEVTLEIVGIVGMKETFGLYNNAVFIPASVWPDRFQPRLTPSGAEGEELATVTSFELRSPRDTQAFLLEAADALEELGLKVTIIESGWESFEPVARSLRSAALWNAVLFGVILLVAVGLLCFVHFRFRRRDVAISRALGVPALPCALGAALPLIVMGGIGALLGGGLGTWYTAAHTGELLSALAEVRDGVRAEMPFGWAALAAGLVFLLTALAALAFGALTVRRPPLTLLQGGRQVRRKPIPAAAPAAPAPAAGAALVRHVSREFTPALAPMRRTGKHAKGFAGRFVRAHILRSPVRSLLALLLAAGFTAATMTVQASLIRNEREIDALYRSIPVEGEVIKANAGIGVSGGGFVFGDTVDRLLETGFLAGGYCEAAQILPGACPVDYENDAHILFDRQTEQVQVYGFNDLDAFLARQDPAPTVTYREDYILPYETDGRTFQQTENQSVISRDLCNAVGLQPDQPSIYVLTPDGVLHPTVIGITDIPGNVVLMPLEAMKEGLEDRILYSVVEFTVVPERARELESFREEAESIVSSTRAGLVPLSVQIWDQQLRQAVDPLEEALGFMQVLYPVVVALSAVLSLGAAALLAVTSSREAALLRALGERKRGARLAVALSVLLPCLVGVVLGQIAGWGAARAVAGTAAGSLAAEAAVCTALYLTASAAGAALGAVLTTRKNPLELLQVKE